MNYIYDKTMRKPSIRLKPKSRFSRSNFICKKPIASDFALISQYPFQIS